MIEVALYSRDRTLWMQRMPDYGNWQEWYTVPMEISGLAVAHRPERPRPPVPVIDTGCACCRAVVVREPVGPVSQLLLGYHGAHPAVELRLGDCPAK